MPTSDVSTQAHNEKPSANLTPEQKNKLYEDLVNFRQSLPRRGMHTVEGVTCVTQISQHYVLQYLFNNFINEKFFV